MKSNIGKTLMVLGLIMISSSVGLLTYNQYKSYLSDKSSTIMLNALHNEIGIKSDTKQYLPGDTLPMEIFDPEMKTIVVDGQEYVGEIQIPDLDINLPVLSDWDYDKMLLAPCRYSGNLKTNDLVLLAHNSKAHFGRISKLNLESLIYFKDINNEITEYEVASIEILKPTQIEEMTKGEYPLTLFTCTYDARSRVTVRCNLKAN